MEDSAEEFEKEMWQWKPGLSDVVWQRWSLPASAVEVEEETTS